MTTRRHVTGPTLWTAATLGPDELVADLAWARDAAHRVVDSLAARTTVAGVPEVVAGDPPFAPIAASLRPYLTTGPGLVIARGLDLDMASDPQILAWLVARSLGPTQPQDRSGARTRLVEAQSASPGHLVPGGSTGSNAIVLHTENARPPRPPGRVVLGCVRQSTKGGASTLCSAHTVHNQLLAGDVSVVDRLFSPFPFGRHDEHHDDGRVTDASPVFWWEGDRLQTRYSRYWLDVGARTTGLPLDAAGQRAAEAVDWLLERDDLVVRHRLEPGDVLVFDNRVVLHGRDGFDPADGARQLVRVWVEPEQ